MRVTAAMAVCLIFTGAACSSSSEPATPPDPEESLTTSAEPSATPKEETATAAPSEQADLQIPDEATEKTEAGAAAFAAFYLEMVSSAGKSPDAEAISDYSEPECSSCKNFENNLTALQNEGLHNASDSAKVGDSAASKTQDGYVAFVEAEQKAYDVVDETGVVVRSYDAVPQVQFKFELSWGTDGWKINEILVTSES